MNLNQWIDERLKDVAAKLPTLVHFEPASFNCGFNSGYKSAILDLVQFLKIQNNTLITGDMVQTYLKEYLTYERTQLQPDGVSCNDDFIAGEESMLDKFDDMVDECLEMLETIMNKEAE